MAIVFSPSFPTTDYLNAFNNNVMRFYRVGTGTTTYATITCVFDGDSVSFNLTKIYGVFVFNFKAYSSVISRLDNFEDSAIIGLGNVADGSNEKALTSVSVRVNFDASNFETTTIYPKFIRNVQQINNVVTYSTTNEQIIMSNSELTFFKGFPYDINCKSYGTTITLDNLTNSRQHIYTTASETWYRLFLSEGYYYEDTSPYSEFSFVNRIEALSGGEIVSNPCYTFETLPLLNVGVNNVTVTDFYGNVTNMTITLKDNCDGVYLKWINENGEWSYWLFSQVYTDTLKAKTLDTFNVDFSNLADTQTTDLITGKQGERFLNLNYKNMTNAEVEQVKSLLTSPRVEWWNGGYNSLTPTLADWQGVLVVDGSFTIRNTKRNLSNISLSIKVNKYTQR